MKIEDLTKNLESLQISDTKRSEILKSKKLSDNFKRICITEPNPISMIYYTLASTLPKDFNEEQLNKIIHAIKEEKIISDKELNRAYNLVKESKEIKFRHKSEEDLKTFLKTSKLTKGAAKAKIIKECEYNLNAKQILELITDLCEDDKKQIKSVLSSGELKTLHTPQTNTQKSPEILKEHLKRTGGIYVTRFPPEPNGNLHIGHAKSLFLNFGYAKLHEGKCIIRFDDTNPKNEKQEYYDSILESIAWMGYPVDKVTAASDHFDKLIEIGFELIKRDKAYVCHQNSEEMKEYREAFKMSPYRERPQEESVKIFRDMLDGKVSPGEATLRLKQPCRKDNPLTMDLVAFRVIDTKFAHSKNPKHVYPTYDFTHCLNDSLEDITHSFCSREFMIRRETYYWLIDALDMYRPVQWEFSRLNISQTVLSKRKLTKLVEEKVVDGWDDPRLYTLIGLRRRGVTPTAINNFVEDVGYTFNQTIIDVKKFEKHIRDDLFKISKKVMVVKNPIEVVILDKNMSVYIEKEDVICCANCANNCDCIIPADFKRLTKNQNVGLINLHPIEFVEFKNNKVYVRESNNNKNIKFIHWVPKDTAEKIKLHLYDHLFNSFNPEEVDMMGDINKDSLIVVENAVVDSKDNIFEKHVNYQFMRIGYFIYDEKNHSFNLTIGLKI